MSSNSNHIDVVVCHYNKTEGPRIRYMALHAMAFLCRERPTDLNVIFSDGSPSRDGKLANGLAGLGVEYLHCGRELSFPETYNAGIKKTSNPVVVTLANDILIEAKQICKLAAEISERVGCVMPYLTFSDYGAQRERKLPVPRRCFPTRMTLNVNAFSRKALEDVGLIPEDMTGCYNDVLLSIRLREKDYSIVLRNVGHVIHLGQQTLKTGATSVALDADVHLLSKAYPQYCRNGVVLFGKIAQRRATRIIYGALEHLPTGLVKKLRLWDAAWAIEPYVCAERGTYKEGLARLFGLGRPARQSSPRLHPVRKL